MRLYRTSNGAFAEDNGKFYLVSADNWDELVSSSDLHARVRTAVANHAGLNFDHATVLAPVVSQEVWAAGVTYYRSRNARIDESKDLEAEASTIASMPPSGRSFSLRRPGVALSEPKAPCAFDRILTGRCLSLS